MDVKEAVAQAHRQGRALLAVNMVNLETAQGIVWGAERVGKPIILMVSHNAARYGGLEELYAIGRILGRKARVPVYLHYDHAEDLADLEAAYALGFDSAMLEVEDEKVLREARRVAGARALEVELEVVGKGGRRETQRGVEELAQLAVFSGADWLVVNLGTRHKALEQNRLHLERLEELRSLGKPLVLHGGSSARLEDLRRAVRLGVAKVNVATAAYHAFTEGVRQQMDTSTDPRNYLGEGRAKMGEWLATFYRELP
ncbi:class II fructose-bisphosphate aldolase [Thermus tenuipuniceus]|uniref:class II fructose-bisphosphate aldolase n=1 Tax=Thermus tenuipuniceus TaxID=2078690 RepID=UPI000CF98DF2|nr:class II fructose-bisphosphate aldolase [Thermus tenuipuniceus]